MSDILIVSALDADGNVIGNYAVDPVARELPGVAHAELRDFPTAPVKTGRQIEVEPGVWVDELGWPGPGWAWNPNVPAWAGPPENAGKPQ